MNCYKMQKSFAYQNIKSEKIITKNIKNYFVMCIFYNIFFHFKQKYNFFAQNSSQMALIGNISTGQNACRAAVEGFSAHTMRAPMGTDAVWLLFICLYIFLFL